MTLTGKLKSYMVVNKPFSNYLHLPIDENGDYIMLKA